MSDLRYGISALDISHKDIAQPDEIMIDSQTGQLFYKRDDGEVVSYTGGRFEYIGKISNFITSMDLAIAKRQDKDVIYVFDDDGTMYEKLQQFQNKYQECSITFMGLNGILPFNINIQGALSKPNKKYFINIMIESNKYKKIHVITDDATAELAPNDRFKNLTYFISDNSTEGLAILQNSNYREMYFCTTSLGKSLGLPTDWAHILYFPHRDTNGYGTQLALNMGGHMDTGHDKWWTMKVRFSTGTTWHPWYDYIDESEGWNRNLVDANLALRNNKMQYVNTSNLPLATGDGVILPFIYNSGRYGVGDTLLSQNKWAIQLLADWHGQKMNFRALRAGVWQPWKELLSNDNSWFKVDDNGLEMKPGRHRIDVRHINGQGHPYDGVLFLNYHNQKGVYFKTADGGLHNLQDLFRYASEGKQKIAAALTGMNTPAATTDSWSTLEEKLRKHKYKVGGKILANALSPVDYSVQDLQDENDIGPIYYMFERKDGDLYIIYPNCIIRKIPIYDVGNPAPRYEIYVSINILLHNITKEKVNNIYSFSTNYAPYGISNYINNILSVLKEYVATDFVYNRLDDRLIFAILLKKGYIYEYQNILECFSTSLENLNGNVILPKAKIKLVTENIKYFHVANYSNVLTVIYENKVETYAANHDTTGDLIKVGSWPINRHGFVDLNNINYHKFFCDHDRLFTYIPNSTTFKYIFKRSGQEIKTVTLPDNYSIINGYFGGEHGLPYLFLKKVGHDMYSFSHYASWIDTPYNLHMRDTNGKITVGCDINPNDGLIFGHVDRVNNTKYVRGWGRHEPSFGGGWHINGFETNSVIKPILEEYFINGNSSDKHNPKLLYFCMSDNTEYMYLAIEKARTTNSIDIKIKKLRVGKHFYINW